MRRTWSRRRPDARPGPATAWTWSSENFAEDPESVDVELRLAHRRVALQAGIGERRAGLVRELRVGFVILAQELNLALDLRMEDGVPPRQPHRRPAPFAVGRDVASGGPVLDALAGGDEHRRAERGQQRRMAAHALVGGDELPGPVAAGDDPVVGLRREVEDGREFDGLDRVEDVEESRVGAA